MNGQIAQRIGLNNCCSIVVGWIFLVIIWAIVSRWVDLWYLLWITAGGFIFQLRRVFRQKFSIQGSDCEDCMLGCFCGQCVTAQMARHLYNYGESCETVWSNDGRPNFEIQRAARNASERPVQIQPVFVHAQPQIVQPGYAGQAQFQAPNPMYQQASPMYANQQPAPMYANQQMYAHQQPAPMYAQTGSSHGSAQGSSHGQPPPQFQQQPPPQFQQGGAPPVFVQVAYPVGSDPYNKN